MFTLHKNENKRKTKDGKICVFAIELKRKKKLWNRKLKVITNAFSGL